MSSAGSTRRGWLYGAAAMLALAAGAGGVWLRARRNGPFIDSPQEDFWARRFERPEGGEIVLQAMRGRPLLLNFWATWCPPCIEEMPMLDGFFRENASTGWQVVGLAIGQAPTIRTFLQRTPVSYPIGILDKENAEWMRQLGNTVAGLPFTLVLDAKGTVAIRKVGRVTASDLQAWRHVQLQG